MTKKEKLFSMTSKVIFEDLGPNLLNCYFVEEKIVFVAD